MKKLFVGLFVFVCILALNPVIAQEEVGLPVSDWKGPVLDSGLSLAKISMRQQADTGTYLIKMRQDGEAKVKENILVYNPEVEFDALKLTDLNNKKITLQGQSVYSTMSSGSMFSSNASIENNIKFGGGEESEKANSYGYFSLRSGDYRLTFYGIYYDIEGNFLMKGRYRLVRLEQVEVEEGDSKYKTTRFKGEKPIVEMGSFVLDKKENLKDSLLEESEEIAQEVEENKPVVNLSFLLNKVWTPQKSVVQDRLGNLIQDDGLRRRDKGTKGMFKSDGTAIFEGRGDHTMKASFSIEGNFISLEEDGEASVIEIVSLTEEKLVARNLGNSSLDDGSWAGYGLQFMDVITLIKESK